VTIKFTMVHTDDRWTNETVEFSLNVLTSLFEIPCLCKDWSPRCVLPGVNILFNRM